MNALIKELGGTAYDSIVYFQHYAQAWLFIDWCIKRNIQCEDVYTDCNGVFYVHYLTNDVHTV
jgi:hypothetical protein